MALRRTMTSDSPSSRLMLTAMICAGAVTAQFVGGKATRDALFLGSLSITALPTIVIATSLCSILFVALNATAARKVVPATLIPAYFAASGLLFLAEWLLTFRAPAVAAVIVYLHISGAGPVLGSGFWLIASERSIRAAQNGGLVRSPARGPSAACSARYWPSEWRRCLVRRRCCHSLPRSIC